MRQTTTAHHSSSTDTAHSNPHATPAPYLQLAPAAMPVAVLIRGANIVGPEKYTAVTQSL
jgi:hypothetical protein